MKAAPTLLQQWENALVFRIGENDSAGLDQFPDFRKFPKRFAHNGRTDDQGAACALGAALGVGFLKLYRPWRDSRSDPASLDPCGGWLYEIVPALRGLPESYAVSVGDAVLMSLGCAIEMALNAPQRLPILLDRIDAMDNETLHKMSMEAVQGIDANADIFEGLYE